MPLSEGSTGSSVHARFDLTGRVAVITGGAGMLGRQHAEAIAEMGGVPVLVDIDGDQAGAAAAEIGATFDVQAVGLQADITRPQAVSGVVERVLQTLGRIDVLVNNAAHNPKIEPDRTGKGQWDRLERFPLERWNQDLAVGLTGAFLCSQLLGAEMARQGSGVILNIASDLSVIAPDQRIYHEPGIPPERQRAKPVSYSVVKHGLIGLTRYLATYWADRGVRVNALSPGGIYAEQDEGFVARLSQLIPLGRMAQEDEYKAAVVFLISDASSYMTGANLVLDGGRSVW
jgi:NAD(P)-dependent dehydrogenase (short-subunit alcohol dehydrogenase family)